MIKLQMMLKGHSDQMRSLKNQEINKDLPIY